MKSKRKSGLKDIGTFAYFLFLFGCNGQQHSQYDAQYGGKQHSHIRREQESDGMCRIPEQRNGFLEYESPQHCPVQFRHNPFHGDGSE